MEVTTVEKTYSVYTNYVRNYRAVGVMWGIFVICFAIINIIVFIQPQWIGDTEDSLGIGYFGLYQYCEHFNSGTTLYCENHFADFGNIISSAFRAATVFIGLSIIFTLICVACLLLFFFMKPSKVFYICGWLLLLAALMMFLGCVIFPVGWDNANVLRICGKDAGRFLIGSCAVRWAYILAIIGIFDVLILAILAFVMASRVAYKPYHQGYNGTVTKSEIAAIETESKPSMIIQPVMAMPEPHTVERQSEYSHASTTRRSRKGDFAL